MPELLNSSTTDARKDGRQLEQLMLTSNEWNLLQELILVLGPFEEATRYLGGEKYITHSIMHPILEEIKRLLLLPSKNSTSPVSPVSPVLPILLSIPSDINLEIQNADDVFVVIEQVEISENNEIINRNNDNNQENQNQIDLNQPFDTNN